MMMRNISVQCFNDSKYIERNLVEKMISIARHYESEDLGGFMMYDRFRKNIIPELIPYRMDLETFISGAAYGMDRGNSYCDTSLKYMKLNQGSSFANVIRRIIREKKQQNKKY